MSGDEFTVLLEGLQSRPEAVEVAERIIESLREPFQVSGKQASTTVSIGIAYSDCGKTGPDGLLQAADAAMYQAKVAGKARYKIFVNNTGLAQSG
jgi:diguanylate cyclase (GGDEF)-like protein